MLPAALLVVLVAFPARGYVPYESDVKFVEIITKDICKLLPRAMGLYVYQNRYDFLRGMTFMTREIRSNPLKLKDLEEIRREAYERLSRDIPYCAQAFKGGDIKLDTSASNLAGRLGMIAYSILLLRMPEFPDLYYLERFNMAFEDLISESVIDVWVFYDGYGDYHSLGELMESLKTETMPTFKHVRNDTYAAVMKEDIYSIFRAPEKFNKQIIITNKDANRIYSDAINNIVDAFGYIWKSSGMELAHPSYSAPPGTIINRPSRRTVLTGGTVQRPVKPKEQEQLAPAEEETEGGGTAAERAREAGAASDVVD